MPRQGRYGGWGKHLELFEMFSDWREDPRVLEGLEEDGLLLEGTGAPEGRADFPMFLLQTIRHRVREGFQAVESRWDRYVGIESAQDFRQHTVSQLNGLVGMGPVPENAEYPRIRSSEEGGPSFAVAKHGGIYKVTFELIINDEVNRILNRTPTELGKMSSAYLTRIIIALIEANPNWIDGAPFFSAARGNEATGAAAEPTETNVATHVSTMKLRRNRDNQPIDIQPRTVLTQNDITGYIFNRMIRSQETGATSNDTSTRTFDKGRLNPIAGILPDDAVATDPWLNDPNDYIYLADPAERPPFVAAFLRGQRSPFIGLKDPMVRDAFSRVEDPYDYELDSIDFKARHVFGAAVGEPMAAFRARVT